MRVRYLSGNLAGEIGELADHEARNAIDTGFAEAVPEEAAPAAVAPESEPEVVAPEPAVEVAAFEESDEPVTEETSAAKPKKKK
jgi:hypothetical protein